MSSSSATVNPWTLSVHWTYNVGKLVRITTNYLFESHAYSTFYSNSNSKDHHNLLVLESHAYTQHTAHCTVTVHIHIHIKNTGEAKGHTNVWGLRYVGGGL